MSNTFKISDVIKNKSRQRIKDYAQMHDICTDWWNWYFNAMSKKAEEYDKKHRNFFAYDLLLYLETIGIKSKAVRSFVYRDITVLYSSWLWNKYVGKYINY